MIVIAVFDQEAKHYDAWYRSKMGSFVDKAETDCALRLFKAKPGMKVLDIGCGTGNFSIKLARMGCKVTGVDISAEMLKVAKDKARSQGLDIEFHLMDAYDLSFPDEYFDGVSSMAAFEFIPDPPRAMAEIFRVVKKGGRIVIGTINKESKWGQLYLSEEFQKNSVFKHADFKSRDDLKKLQSAHLQDMAECLFIPPDAKEEEISMEREAELAKDERGGFLCVLWRK